MAMIKVRECNVDVDIEKEISEYSWSRARWMPDRLIACSPFRYDSSPSFYVYFYDTATARAGAWGDSGGEDDYKKGTFVKLLAFLRNESEFETEEYLLATYAREYTEDDEIAVDFSRLRTYSKPLGLRKDFLDTFSPPSDYLAGRGVSEAIQREMDIRYDSKKRAVVIPWHFADGRLANAKYRHVDSKIFYYAEGYPVLELVYGIHAINRKDAKSAVLVEAEIDALFIKSVTDTEAIAAGTSKLSNEKAELIARSSLEEIIILADNDKAGRELEQQAIDKLSRYGIRIKVAKHLEGFKDANDYQGEHIAKLQNIINEAETVGFSLFG